MLTFRATSGTQDKKAPRATSGTKGKNSARATSGTHRVNSSGTMRKPSGTQKPEPPPTPAGHEWRYADSGWVLYRRTSIITASGKRSSKRDYLAFYTPEAIARIYGTNRKTATNS